MILLFLGSSFANAEVYYCTVKGNGGFDIDDKKEGLLFKYRRFKVKIDIYKPFVEGEEIYFVPSSFPTCRYPKYGKA